MNYDKIGKFIQEKRKEKNLTQKELAEKTGIIDSEIYNLEKGLYIPDILVLEKIAKELECTLLEIIQGKTIENETLKVNEVDDYIKDSMNISKRSTKEKIIDNVNVLLVGTVVCVFLLLSYLNIVQIDYVKRVNTYYLSKSEQKTFLKQVNIVKDNLNTIRNNKGIFSDSDYEAILKSLNVNYTSIIETELYKHAINNEKINYLITDYYLYSEIVGIKDPSLLVLARLGDYGSNEAILKYKDYWYTLHMNTENTSNFLNVYNSYQYRLVQTKRTFRNAERIDMRNAFYKIKNELYKLEQLTELVIEVGEMNE